MNTPSTKLRHAQRLLNIGLAHAAQAFSQIVNQEVGFDILCLTTSKVAFADAAYRYQDDVALVVTDVIGEVDGRSYLLFSGRARTALREMCVPDTLSAEQRIMMEEAVLKEVDNIVTAAVITKLSEALDLHIYGGVPCLSYLPAERTQEKLHEEFAHEDDLLVNARFLFETNSQIQPQFLWKFPPAFLHGLNSNDEEAFL